MCVKPKCTTDICKFNLSETELGTLDYHFQTAFIYI